MTSRPADCLDQTDAQWRQVAQETRDPQLRSDLLRMLDAAGAGRVPVRRQPGQDDGDDE